MGRSRHRAESNDDGGGNVALVKELVRLSKVGGDQEHWRPRVFKCLRDVERDQRLIFDDQDGAALQIPATHYCTGG